MALGKYINNSTEMLECFDNVNLPCNGWEQDANVDVMVYLYMLYSYARMVLIVCRIQLRTNPLCRIKWSANFIPKCCIRFRSISAQDLFFCGCSFVFWPEIDFASYFVAIQSSLIPRKYTAVFP